MFAFTRCNGEAFAFSSAIWQIKPNASFTRGDSLNALFNADDHTAATQLLKEAGNKLQSENVSITLFDNAASGEDMRMLAQAIQLFVLLFNGFKQFTDGITQTQTAMWLLLGGNALNIAGNYVLINGKLGLPELGLLGAGLSTLLSRIAMVVVFALIIWRSRRYARYRVGIRRLGWSKAVFSRLNALGWPVGLQMGMETASFSLSTVMVGWLGTMTLASHQIMLTISQFTFMMFYGMGAAVAVRVSNFNGQGDVVNVRRSAYAGFHLIVFMGIILLSIVFACRSHVGGWFTDNAEVSALVSALFFPFLIYQLGDGLQINFANALRGMADVRPMMLIAFIAYFVISLPVGYLCGFVLGWGLVGVWMAFPFGLTSAGLMLWLRFRKQTSKG